MFEVRRGKAGVSRRRRRQERTRANELIQKPQARLGANVIEGGQRPRDVGRERRELCAVRKHCMMWIGK